MGPRTLEETIALLEATLEATRDGLVVLDADRRVVRCNQTFLQMFGLSAAQVEGRSAADVLRAVADQFDDPERDDVSLRLWAEPSTEAVDVRLKDGRIYRRFVAAHRRGGAVIGGVISYRDITQTVRTEEALREHRALLEKAQEIAHIGSWVAEIEGQRLDWSAETHRIFGVDAAGFPGTVDAFLAYVHPDDKDLVRRAARTALAGEQPYDVEHRIIRADADVRWVHERADVVRGPDGTARRLVGTVEDITERRTLEEQLRQSQKLEAIGRLAGGVAHDINNALTAIVGYTELALGVLADDHAARADVEEIRRAAGRAESITRQLLAFSRKQLLEPRVFSLSETVTTLGRFLERLLGGTVSAAINAPPDLPPIYGDPGQIEQAIVNLAVNARDAMPSGGTLTLSVRLEEIDETAALRYRPMPPGQYVSLAVADTGHGMAAETQAHIFEPFFTTKVAGKGTGLGLAMVYGTVKQSGGFIFVESAVGRGTTFRLFFPPAEPARTERSAPAVDVRPATTPCTLLVVEDEPAVRHLVLASLRTEGYRLLEAASGEEALQVADAEQPIDLLLSDASMPGMSGIELANTLIRLRPQLRVVIMSGYTGETLAVRGLPGPVSLLSKPFTPRDLRQKIKDVLAS